MDVVSFWKALEEFLGRLEKLRDEYPEITFFEYTPVTLEKLRKLREPLAETITIEKKVPAELPEGFALRLLKKLDYTAHERPGSQKELEALRFIIEGVAKMKKLSDPNTELCWGLDLLETELTKRQTFLERK